MFWDVFLRDYFDNIIDEEELNHEMNETLITWLVGEGIFNNPINSIEDANVESIEILSSRHAFENDALIVYADYIAVMTCYYVSRDGRDKSFTAKFELTGKFTLSEINAVMNAGDLLVTYRLKEALPTEQIKILR